MPELRRVAKQAGGDATLVGGPTAQEYDLRKSAARDNRVIIPLTLVVVFLILAVLLRALRRAAAARPLGDPELRAALGVGVFVSDAIFGFPGVDPALPLLCFVFLVALGIDYNIFLMARVREEAIEHGTREGTLRGLAVTGAVITGAGIVLAGTFGALAVLPLVVADRDRLHRRLRRPARHLHRALRDRPRTRDGRRPPRLVAVAAVPPEGSCGRDALSGCRLDA